MCSRRFVTYVTTTVIVFLLAVSSTAIAASVPLMTTDELNGRLGEADLVILDVRLGGHQSQSNDKIPGSESVDYKNVNLWVNNYAKEKTIVLYCA